VSDAPGNIAARLSTVAARVPEKLAVIESGRQICFRELEALCDAYAHGLTRIGIRKQTRTVLMVRPGIDFFALTFALFKVGAVPVMVDPGMGRDNLGQCLDEAEPEAFIGIPKAQMARILLGWGQRTIRLVITAGTRWLWSGYTLVDLARIGRPLGPYELADSRPQEVAAILFTSGSTGVPKGAVYTHGIFTSQVDLLQGHFGMGPDEIDLPTFPLFALFDAALGLTAVIPDMDFTRPAEVEPRNIILPIHRHGVTQMFGSPALLDRVGQYGVKEGLKLRSIKRVISAGAPVSPAVLERFASMLSPEARIHTPYGATEALPVSSITDSEILGETKARSEQGHGICVGKPMPGIDVQIIRITDDPIEGWSDELVLPDGDVGEIAVRGPVVTASYHGREEATRLSKVPVSDGTFFHRMGDLGYRDHHGRLWFCGRKSHRVVTAASTLFTIPCEAVFNQHPRVRRTALVGIGSAGVKRPVLCVEVRENADHAALTEELKALGQAHPHTREIETILFHPGFPVDIRHNAKIRREDLASWAEQRLGAVSSKKARP